MPGSLTTETISKLPEVSNRGQKSEQMGPTIHCISISQGTGIHCVPLVVFLDEYRPGEWNVKHKFGAQQGIWKVSKICLPILHIKIIFWSSLTKLGQHSIPLKNEQVVAFFWGFYKILYCSHLQNFHKFSRSTKLSLLHYFHFRNNFNTTTFLLPQHFYSHNIFTPTTFSLPQYFQSHKIFIPTPFTFTQQFHSHNIFTPTTLSI